MFKSLTGMSVSDVRSLLPLAGVPCIVDLSCPRTLFSSIFIHWGIAHLVGNLVFLWIVGDNVETDMGSLRFALLFILSGLIGTLTQAVFTVFHVVPSYPLFIVGAVILPPIWYGVCTAMRRHKGTIDISPETLSRLVVEVLREANRNGARLAVIINGHGGNTQALHYAARVASRLADIAVAVVDWWRDVAEDTRRRLFEKPGHAGEDETSAMLAIKPELVGMRRAEIAEGDYPPYKLYYRRVEESIYSKALTGDARIAEQGKGREWLEAVVDEIVEIIGSLRSYLEGNA